MAYSAKYFDGQTSKPQLVEVMFSSSNVTIRIVEKNINKYWKLDACTIDSFNSSKKLIVKYGSFPFESLEFEGRGVNQAASYFHQNSSLIEKSYDKIFGASAFNLIVGGFATMAFVVFAYLKWFSPWIGTQAVKIIPKEMEVAIGKDVFNRLTSFNDINEEKSALLMEFYELCQFESEYPVEIHFVDDEIVNAFAAPGGQIVIFQGIIDEMKCWDELAGLMGHELAHVNQRHSFKILARTLSSYIILSVLTGDVAGTSGIILENINQINQLANSRSFEKEADVIGLSYLKKSKIRPEAMRDLFMRLLESSEISEELDEKFEKYSSKLEILSSHPLSKNRIAYIDEIIEQDSSFHYETKDMFRAMEIWEELKVVD